jgi:endonuclease YncB( thermonuclease family)
MAAIVALALLVAGVLYIQIRWRRSPHAYKGMIVLAVGYFAAGILFTVWLLHPPESKKQAAGVGPGPSSEVAPSSSVPVSAAAPKVGISLDYLPNKYTGRVAGVTDGDTIDVALNPSGQIQAIRLAGIDAPESAEAFGSQSTHNLSGLVSGKTVTLACENETSYGRSICKVILPDGEDASLDQVKAGMAWHYKQYQDEQSTADRETYAAAECTAMKSKLGLWSEPHPVQPQDFRHHTDSPLLYDANGCRRSSEPATGTVVGNARSHIFEWPGCPYYSTISPYNRVSFGSPQAAEAAGYRPAHNCP